MSREHLIVMIIWALLGAGCATAPKPVALAVAAAPTTQAMDSAKGQAAAEPVALPAAFNARSAPSSQPTADVMQTDVADAFDSQLQRLISGQTATDPSVSSLPPDERELITTVCDSLSSFRLALRNGDGLMATRVAPLLALSDRIKAQTPLTLPIVALCRSVTQFGVYDPVDPPQLAAGKETTVIVYCEVDNFTSQTDASGALETKLNYQAVLYSDGEHSAAVLGKQPAFPDAATSANWTMVGICAHQSATEGGKPVKIPEL